MSSDRDTRLIETFARWSMQGRTDDFETPIDNYGKRILSMVIRELQSSRSLEGTEATAPSTEVVYICTECDYLADPPGKYADENLPAYCQACRSSAHVRAYVPVTPPLPSTALLEDDPQ